MRNIWTIARKELRAYFDHPTAYILLVVFLVINFFFYFRSVLLVGVASVRPMFDLLPWILLFFIPAVTMSAFAEEKRHGTLEVILSHPINHYDLLLGKYLGNLLFVAIALGATAFVPLLLLLGGKPDFGVVVAQYVGSLLLAGAMVAVGMFASAATRNQITAFIIGTATLFVCMLLGAEVIQIGLPSWLAEPIGELGILPHFFNVARGVIDLRDVVYFVGVIAAFLSLAYWLLLRDRLNRSGPLYRNLRLGTLLVVGIAVVANLFGRHIPGRLDLTADNLYTLSRGTKTILSDLDDLVTITLFVSKDLPTQVTLTERDVNDVLRDFRRYGRGNVQVLRKHPDQSTGVREEAQSLGVQPVQFNVIRREELQLKQGWLGIAVQYADRHEAIPFVGNPRNLEYQLATHVWNLTRSDTSKIAFVTGHGERTATDYAAFRRELGRSYQISDVDLSSADSLIDLDVDAVVVAGPRRPLDERSRRHLRDYLARDGRMLYLGEGVDINLQFLFASAAPDSVRDFVEEFGVRLNGDLVFDLRSNENITMPGQFFNYVVAYPFWVRALPASEHPIVRGINSVFLPWPSSLDTLQVFGREITPLLVTTEFAGHQAQSFQIRPDQQLVYDQKDLKGYTLAVALQPSGVESVESAAETEAASEGPEGAGSNGAGDAVQSESGEVQSDTVTAEGEAAEGISPVLRPVEKRVFGPPRGRLVIVGDADFLSDQYVRNSLVNAVFGLNALDWLTQSQDLVSIRSKAPTPRPLVFASDFQKQMIKYLNLAGVPLAFVVFGTVRLFRRRRLSRRHYGS
ncbi:MAG: Gldg family protein [Gemmatimonadota bacterium]